MDRWELTATFRQFGTEYKRRWTFKRKHDLDDHDRIIRKNPTYQHSRAVRIMQPYCDAHRATSGMGQPQPQA